VAQQLTPPLDDGNPIGSVCTLLPNPNPVHRILPSGAREAFVLGLSLRRASADVKISSNEHLCA
jgi:hypothetical protein